MLTAQRYEVRRSLIDLGFRRSGGGTLDNGDGRYEEVWVRSGGATITIKWDARDD